MLSIFAVIVGDELLDGFVSDANGPWLLKRCHELGTPLRSLHVVRDDIEDVEGALRQALLHGGPRLVLACGGVGTTWDDVTYESVARTLDCGLRYDADLAEPVEYVMRYMEEAGFPMDDDAVEAMHRIANVPEKATTRIVRRFLACTITDIDGGCGDEDGATIITLPGPPGHLQAVFDAVVAPEFIEGRGEIPVSVEVMHGYPEHILAGAIKKIRREHPEVKIGSYPGTEMCVRFQGSRHNVDRCVEAFREVLDQIDQHPASADLRRIWQRQVAEWT